MCCLFRANINACTYQFRDCSYLSVLNSYKSSYFLVAALLVSLLLFFFLSGRFIWWERDVIFYYFSVYFNANTYCTYCQVHEISKDMFLFDNFVH